ncbi:hypothetical protein [Streptosporangium fragile]
MRKSQQETTNLSRKMTETGASADRMRERLEAATKALPKIEIDADSSPAEIKFAQLRAQLEALADKKIGVDIDADAARAELAQIERELEQLQQTEVDINVRADLGTALAELRAIDGEVSRVDGRTARVDVNADVGGALASIGMVGAALASLPAVTTVAVGVTALGGAFAAAGAGAASFAAVAVPSLGRINEALKAQEAAAKAAGGATGGAGQSAAQAALQAMQLEQAEKRLADAQRDERQAQEDLTRAREAGRRALEDMNFSLERSVLSQKDAALAVREAEARLAQVMADPKSSQLEIERAMLSVEQAQQRAREQEVKTQRAKKDTAAANRAGVEGTREYQRGLEDLRQAQDKVAQAEQQLKQLHLQQQQAMSGGGGAAAKAADAFADLSKAERKLATDLKAFQDEYLAWQQSLQPDVFPAIHQGLDLMRLGLQEAGPMAKSAGVALLELGQDAEKALRGPFWQDFLFDINTQIPGAITSLGRTGINTFTGLAGVVQAFLPYTQDVLGSIEGMSEAWSQWGQNLDINPRFHEFLLWVQENGPAAVEVVLNLAKAGGTLVEGLAPVAGLSWTALGVLAEILAGMDPAHITAIAVAIIAIKTAQTGLKVASFFGELPGRADAARGKLDAFGEAVGRTRDKAKGLGATLGDLGGKLGGVAGAVGGAGLVGGLLVLGSRLEANATAAERFAEKTVALGGGDLNRQIAAVTAELDKQRQAIGFNIANTIYLSDAEREAADNVAALETRLGQLKHQKELDAIASKVAGDAAGEHGRKVGELNTALDVFAGKTNALQAMRNMETAHRAAAAAIDASNGKLQVSAGMTDAQKDAVLRAREAFSGYITSIRAAADGAATLSGKQTDGTRVILEQLPRLAELAGKSGEAKQQILLLAQAYGISAEDAKKAMAGGKGLQEVLEKLKSKQIKIDMDIKEAEARLKVVARWLEDLQRRAQLKLVGGLNPTSARGNAWGGIQYRDGRPDYMAQGGIRPLGANPGAMIARSPYLISGRAGPNVVFGEAGAEAFIPLDPGKRGRGLQILQEAAGIMGMAVVPQGVDAGSAGGSFAAGSIAGSGPAGGAMVTVTGIDALRSEINTTAVGLTSSLGSATSTLDAALGDTGTLTGAVDGLGEAATGWGEVIAVQIPPLTDAVTLLGEAVSAAASAAGGDAKGGSGGKGSERSPRDGKAKGKATPAEQKVMIQGAASVTGAAGVALPGGGTNWSRMSRPVQGAASWSPAGPGPASAGSAASAGSGGATPGGGGPLLNIENFNTTERMSADEIVTRLSFKMGNRG